MWKLVIDFRDSFKAERSGIIYYGETKEQCINMLAQIVCNGDFDINMDSIFVGDDGIITGYTLGKVDEEDKSWYEAEFFIEECSQYNVISDELDEELVNEVEELLNEIIGE